uniref:Uncharacterized protein n=1 Tax=Ictidomys tridecemlineatus TaxID=43179 RepID=A0A287DC42_ICTTR
MKNELRRKYLTQVDALLQDAGCFEDPVAVSLQRALVTLWSLPPPESWIRCVLAQPTWPQHLEMTVCHCWGPAAV